MRKCNGTKERTDMGMIKMLSVFVGIVNYAICFDDNSAMLPPLSCCEQTLYDGKHGRCQYGQISAIGLTYGFCYDYTNNPVVNTVTRLYDQSCGIQPHLKVPCGSTAAPVSQPVPPASQSANTSTPSNSYSFLPYVLPIVTIFTSLI